MTNRKTVGTRLGGYSKSERVEAKFLLLAMAPLIPLIVSDKLGWTRGILWKVWGVLSIVWYIVIAGLLMVSMGRAFWRAVRDRRNGS